MKDSESKIQKLKDTLLTPENVAKAERILERNGVDVDKARKEWPAKVDKAKAKVSSFLDKFSDKS